MTLTLTAITIKTHNKVRLMIHAVIHDSVDYFFLFATLWRLCIDSQSAIFATKYGYFELALALLRKSLLRLRAHDSSLSILPQQRTLFATIYNFYMQAIHLFLYFLYSIPLVISSANGPCQVRPEGGHKIIQHRIISSQNHIKNIH